MKKSVVLLIAIYFIISAIGGSVIYILYNIVCNPENNKIELPVEGEPIQIISPNSSSSYDDNTVRKEYLRAELAKNQVDPKNDKLALEIMEKYGVTDSSEYIEDRSKDLELMQKMCSMYQNGNFDSHDSQIIRNYVIQRLYFYIDDVQLVESLAQKIKYKIP